ncbi:5-formyltetrahydrofolate cyclo-ligase [Tessaracoccus sp. G1721]
MTLSARKDALRARISAARARVTPEQWHSDNALRTAHLLEMADQLPTTTASVYASRAGEPGTRALIDELVTRGWAVLIPKLTPGVAWARFDGLDSTVPGWGGIPNPVAAPLAPEVLGEAGLIVVPCLAVGPDGSRLGTGGGWYDRALLHRAPDTPVVAVARHVEVLDDLAALTLPHDIPVDGYVTERVSVRLPR